MSEVIGLDDQLNQLILQGKPMEAFEQFYAEDCVMQENTDEPCEGKDANRKREEDFFDMIKEFHGATLHNSAISSDVTFSEWTYDMTFKDGNRVKLTQVARRHWKAGKVAHERFYYDPPY